VNEDWMVAKYVLGSKKTAKKFRGMAYKPGCLREGQIPCFSSILCSCEL